MPALAADADKDLEAVLARMHSALEAAQVDTDQTNCQAATAEEGVLDVRPLSPRRHHELIFSSFKGLAPANISSWSTTTTPNRCAASSQPSIPTPSAGTTSRPGRPTGGSASGAPPPRPMGRPRLDHKLVTQARALGDPTAIASSATSPTPTVR